MGRNLEFGRNVRRAREKLGMKQKRLAQLVGAELFRLQNLESEQEDESGFTDEELKRFAEVLNTPLCRLLHKAEDSHRPHCQRLELVSGGRRLPAGVVARRGSKAPVQDELDFISGCPHCGFRGSASSAKCDNCGRPLE
jgi:transcriptional regulator with XRE-family HTH domain